MDINLVPELFLVPPPEDLLCTHCLQTLQEPHLMSCCGTHICEKCIDKFKNAKRSSPCCHEKFGSYTTLLDKGVKRKVEDLEVHCMNGSKDCKWNGRCGDLVNHLKHDCLAQPQPCPNKCGGIFPRHLLNYHLEKQCAVSPQGGETSANGSNKIAAANTEKKKSEMTEKENSEMKSKIIGLKAEMDDLKTELLKNMEIQIESKGQNLLHQLEKKVLETTKAHQDTTMEMFAAHQKEIESKLQKHKAGKESDTEDKQLAQAAKPDLESKWINSEWCIPVMPTPTLLPLPPCIITMIEFEKNKKLGNEWFSPKIYSKPDGYRFVVGVQACGSGQGKNTHVSLTVYLAKGEHDEKLKWPFHGSVHISLLNWRERSSNIVAKVIFDSRASANGLSSRVTKGENRAARGNGYPRFVAHQDLHFNEKKNTEYLHNDTLCFQVTKIETQF